MLKKWSVTGTAGFSPKNVNICGVRVFVFRFQVEKGFFPQFMFIANQFAKWNLSSEAMIKLLHI
jgi:hypothetical protein